MMVRFQPKSVKVDARQFDGAVDAPLEKWLGKLYGSYRPSQNGLPAELRVLIAPTQTATARPGDWIVKGGDAGVHVYTAEAFEQAFEEVPAKSAKES